MQFCSAKTAMQLQGNKIDYLCNGRPLYRSGPKYRPVRKVRATKGTMLPNGKSGESLKQRNRK
jgi:hypothetical protein